MFSEALVTAIVHKELALGGVWVTDLNLFSFFLDDPSLLSFINFINLFNEPTSDFVNFLYCFSHYFYETIR